MNPSTSVGDCAAILRSSFNELGIEDVRPETVASDLMKSVESIDRVPVSHASYEDAIHPAPVFSGSIVSESKFSESPEVNGSSLRKRPHNHGVVHRSLAFPSSYQDEEPGTKIKVL